MGETRLPLIAMLSFVCVWAVVGLRQGCTFLLLTGTQRVSFFLAKQNVFLHTCVQGSL